MEKAAVQYKLDPNRSGPVINRNIYGHFAEHLGRGIYEGLWVGEESNIPHTRGIRDDVVEALRKLNMPVLRWPGGCFADEYHWKDGIGPREQRPSLINTHWGGVVENNHFGTRAHGSPGSINKKSPALNKPGSFFARLSSAWVRRRLAWSCRPELGR